MLKIISGQYRNIIIPTVQKVNYRPSTAKIKEAIFSILTSGEFINYPLFVDNINVLDLFSGSGSLAFEALSRGAEFATFMDINFKSLKIAEEFARNLNLTSKTDFVNINILNLPKAYKTFDLIFIDPPYHNDLVPKVMKLLIKNGWLKEGSIIVIEMAKTDHYILDKNISVMCEKLYGKSKLLILKYSVL